MKFEKFVKAAGTHGKIVDTRRRNKWLVCEGVGMEIPFGVNSVIGGLVSDERDLVTTIQGTLFDDGDVLKLKRAVLPSPDGKASDIIRVFESADGDEIGISNTDYGFLESSDILTYLAVWTDEDEDGEGADHDDDPDFIFMVVWDQSEHIVGFISGSTDNI